MRWKGFLVQFLVLNYTYFTMSLARATARQTGRLLAATSIKATNQAACRACAALEQPRLQQQRPSFHTRNLSKTARRQATSTTAASSTIDPSEQQAQLALDQGTIALTNGDLEGAAVAYEKSLSFKESQVTWYNLGVVRYQQRDVPRAIESFEKSLALTPKGTFSSPLDPNNSAALVLVDVHVNLGAAYITSKPPNVEKSLEHLQKALAMSPDDGDVCYNLGAVLEVKGDLEEALIAYQRAEKLGVDRAKINIRNLGAKIIGKRRQEEEETATGRSSSGSSTTSSQR